MTNSVLAYGRGVGAGPVVRATRRLVDWFQSRRQIRSGIDDLMALDDHLLSDIGLSRGHIEYAARFGRPPEE